MHDFQIIPIRFGVAADEEGEATPSTPLHLASAWLPDQPMADWLRTFTPRPIVEKVRRTEAASLSVNVNAVPTGGWPFFALPRSRHFRCV